MLVKGYSFGRIEIDGREYREDIIVSSESVINPSWWRKRGHKIVPEDIAEIVEADPEVVVFGTGNSGLVKVSQAVFEELEEGRVEVIAQPTARAVESFNQLAGEGRRVVLAAHLTC